MDGRDFALTAAAGGHIIPALAVAPELVARHAAEVLSVGAPLQKITLSWRTIIQCTLTRDSGLSIPYSLFCVPPPPPYPQGV